MVLMVCKADGVIAGLGRSHGCSSAQVGQDCRKIAILGYHYLQSETIRHISLLLDEKILSEVNLFSESG